MALPTVNTNLPAAPARYDGIDEAQHRRLVQTALAQLAVPKPVLGTAYTPSGSADGAGQVGEVAYDSGFVYIKTAAGAWKRATLSTF